MHITLQVIRGAKPVSLTIRLPTIIGRSGYAKIKLPASTVSRNHCELYEYEGQLAVRDLGSSNGTVVNGHRINAPTFFTAEDELTVGPVTLRLVGDLSASASSAPASDARSDSVAAAGSVGSSESSHQPVPAAESEPAVTDGPAKSDEENSVLASSENSDGSFIGITPVDGTCAAPDDAAMFEGIGETEQPAVKSDDSELNSFLKNLDT